MSDRPKPKRRPGFVSTTSFLRVAVCEAAVVGGLALSWHTRLAGVVAAPLAAVTLARRDGRWWVDHRAAVHRFRRRRRAQAAGHRDPRVRALMSLAPALAVGGTHDDTGVAHDGAGWFAVAAIASDPDRFDPAGTVDRLLPDLAAVLRDSGVPGATVQLVTHTVPAPHPDLGPDCAAAVAYRELFDVLGPVPADRTQWLAVRADAEALAAAGVRDPSQAPVIVAGLARRAAHAASRGGRTASVLSADGLIAALARSCAVGPADSPHEEWDAWHCGRLAHRTFWLREWPQARDAHTLLERLALVPAAMTSLALVIGADPASDPDTIEVRCLIRVACRPSGMAGACETLESTAGAFEAALADLDGEQGPAAYASAPTGGGPR